MRVRRPLTQLAPIILCYGSTECDEVDDYFTTQSDTMLDILCVAVFLGYNQYLPGGFMVFVVLCPGAPKG